MKAILAAAALVLSVAPAFAQTRPFDPRTYQDRHVGQPTQIFVLGTPHLSGTPDTFDAAVLDPLLARLAAFRPNAIAIEALPGRSISQMWTYRETYPNVAHDYGGRAMVLAGIAGAATNLDMPAAEAEAARTLRSLPESPSPQQRRRLAAVFAAAGDPASALVQWWSLAPSERIADDNISRLLKEQFDTYETPPRRNENYLIASRLAVRLGLERIYPMDDQSDLIGAEYDGDFETDMTAFTNEPWVAAMLADPRFAPLRDASQHLTSSEEALATYRMLNRPQTGRFDADSQWLNMINRESPHGAGRTRVAAWETRNLRMAANIREVASQFPGGRVLVIVGSAHKPWLDAYLGMMSDVQIVDAGALLR